MSRRIKRGNKRESLLDYYIERLSNSETTNCRRKANYYLKQLKRESECSEIVSNTIILDRLIDFVIKDPNSDLAILSLSVLADACRSNNVREKVLDTHVMDLTRILELDDGNFDLQSRAYRCIGNLCKSSNHAKTFYEAGGVQFLSSVLSFFAEEENFSKPTETTVVMAIRTVRKLWCNCDESRDEILRSEILKNIANLFGLTIATRLKGQQNLGQECLEAIETFLSNAEERRKVEIGTQLTGSKKLVGYKTLVTYCMNGDKLSSLALKCMLKLCQIAERRPEMGNAGAIPVIVNKVRKERTPNDHALNIFCLFSREAINRIKLRDYQGLELILELLKKDQYNQYHPPLLQALTEFCRDEINVRIMLTNGLIDILANRLNVMEQRGPLYGNCRKSMFKSNRYSFDFQEDQFDMYKSKRLKSDICENGWNSRILDSDNEMSENIEPQGKDESLKNDVSKTDIESEHFVPTDDMEIMTNNWTLDLLYVLSNFQPTVSELAEPCIIKPLVSYIGGIIMDVQHKHKALCILKQIIKKSCHLMPLVKQEFVFNAQALDESEQLIKLLCQVAETDYAIGELMSTLKQGKDDQKFTTVVSIPFLVTSKCKLRKLLNDDGLSLIFYLLELRRHDLHQKAVWSICHLAKTLKIQPEMISSSFCFDDTSFDSEPIIPRLSKVTFVLDDGSTVETCRKTLCQESDVFKAMLEGKFVESGKEIVQLRNTSKGGLETLIQALNGTEFENERIEWMLDAMLLADRYLISRAKNILTNSLVSNLNHTNFSRAWNWARENSFLNIKTYCVKSFLTMKMTHDERNEAFNEFSENVYFLEFLDDIRSIINKELCQF